MAGMGWHPETISAKMVERNWTEDIDIEKLLSEANQRKHWQVEKEQDEQTRREREKAEKINSYKKCDAVYFFNLIKNYFLSLPGNGGKPAKFIHDETNRRYIKSVCFLFSNDIRFETELGFSFNKGLMISGSAGLGKTKVIEAVSKNKINPVSIYSLIEITEHVRKTGDCEINPFKTILLDDVGSENTPVKYYGDEINWFKEFVGGYYLNHKNFKNLLITTNCGGDELEQKYGYPVRSRLREMFNQINLAGEDKR